MKTMPIPAIDVLGVKISLVGMNDAISQIAFWIANGVPNYVCIRDMHGVMLCRKDAELRDIHRRAGLVTPDGMSVLWLCKAYGQRDVERVCGPDLLPALCRYSVERGYRHFFYGGAPGVADRLAERLRALFPGIDIVGTHCPPFSDATPSVDDALADRIKALRPDIIWVGLGSPKQEYWIGRNNGRFGPAILIGIGAAFDFYAGTKKRAPVWMQKCGLEWLHRLASEPRRLSHRYLHLGSQFAVLAVRDVLRFHLARANSALPKVLPGGGGQAPPGNTEQP